MRRRFSRPAPYSPVLRRLGLATPPPFVGRSRELATLAEALVASTSAVVHGAVGAGKTRLAHAIARHGTERSLPSCYVRCAPGDRGAALRARAERALGALPGSLEEVLRREARLLIIDDAHNLPPEDAACTFNALLAELGAGRLLLLTREILPLQRKGAPRHETNLEGLEAGAARELWAHLEDTYGPTPKDACDDALARTRGMPLALRREYAMAAVGEDAWEIAALAEASRRALEMIAVVRIPVAPAAVAALAPEIDGEQTLIDLVSRQLIDPLEDGRFAMHDVVRDEVLRAMAPEARRAAELAAFELIASLGGGKDGRRPAWEAGDDGALGLVDPIDRTREAVYHLLEAREIDRAVDQLLEDRAVALRRGGGGEIGALIERIELVHGGAIRRLAGLRAEIAARQGRVAEAIVHAGMADPVAAAELAFHAGDVREAVESLERLCGDDSADLRSRAAALLAEVELDRGAPARALDVAAAALERDRELIGDDARGRLHMAIAAVEARGGNFGSARAALSRAASSGNIDPVLSAQIEARRAMCLAEEGRLSEAERVLAGADSLARELDAAGVADEVRRCRALMRGLAGALGVACEELRDLAYRRRERGDEVGALRAEIDLARLLERRGELSQAAELASACSSAAAGRALHGLGARAELVSAAIELGEFRLDEARRRLTALAVAGAADATVRAAAAGLLSQVEFRFGDGPAETAAETPEALDLGASCRRGVQAAIFLASRDPAAALELARREAVRAERAGRIAEMAEALALFARLQAARGERPAAAAAARRAAREAELSGLARARADALLVLAALAREEGNSEEAVARAREAAEIATRAGLPVERLVSSHALEVIAGRAAGPDALRGPAAATMSEAALEAAAQMLADLGLAAARPYRVIGANAEESLVADASPEVLRLGRRELAVDGVREVIVRAGKQVADLRRRSLLKRLLFLFAGSPNRTFSKEEIVEKVWGVDYHPLRHDAALFTNIMRIRRLLGRDGADLIRVSEDGYRFVPPRDFLFVESVTE